MNWKENSIKPKEEGLYLTTHLRAQMCGSHGGESYGWELDFSYFDGECWENSGVLAWAELPCPYFTSDDKKKEELLQTAYDNDTLYEEKFNKLKYSFQVDSLDDKCPFWEE